MKGDVLLVDFPFSLGGGSKVRPALAAQGNAAHLVNTRVSSPQHHTVTTTLPICWFDSR